MARAGRLGFMAKIENSNIGRMKKECKLIIWRLDDWTIGRLDDLSIWRFGDLI
jgi:hypothetical protein